MSPDKPSEDPFVAEVRRQAERAKTSRDAPFWRRFASVGAIGWMISLPAVLGALAGRWLDVQFKSGIFWTLSLLLAGVALGCASAWRHVSGELKE
jgi:ATP synthase protein I